jgi:hypothetical protein
MRSLFQIQAKCWRHLVPERGTCQPCKIARDLTGARADGPVAGNVGIIRIQYLQLHRNAGILGCLHAVLEWIGWRATASLFASPALGQSMETYLVSAFLVALAEMGGA